MPHLSKKNRGNIFSMTLVLLFAFSAIALSYIKIIQVKSKENRLESSYEDRLSKVCQKPAVNALSVAISSLSEDQKISRDQAAIQLIETVRELEKIWEDYVIMEGINNLKSILKNKTVN